MEVEIHLHGSAEAYLDYKLKKCLTREQFASNYYIDYLINCTKAKVLEKDIWFSEADKEWRWSIKIQPTQHAKDNIKIIEYKDVKRR